MNHSRTKSFSRESRGKWQLIVERFPWIRQETRYDTNRSSNGLELDSSRYSNRTMRVFFAVRQRTLRRIKGKRDKTCRETFQSINPRSSSGQRWTTCSYRPCIRSAIKLAAFTTTPSKEQSPFYNALHCKNYFIAVCT